MRAKFYCQSVTFHGDPENTNTMRTYTLGAVYDHRTAENERFARYTPTGELKISVDNPAAALQVGEEYYLDFTACTVAEAEVKPEDMGNTHDVTGTYTPDHAAPEDPTPETRSGVYTDAPRPTSEA